jgi:hypothetical protein
MYDYLEDGFTLVGRVQSALAEAFNTGEDLVSGFRPDERFGIQVGLLNVSLDCGLQSVGADKEPVLEAAPGQKKETAFHQIEPRGTGGGKVQMPARPLQQPVMHQACLVAGGIVEHRVHI